MALFNGKILKGDDCPYKDKCNFKDNACFGDGCPFKYRTEHYCDFSCGAARLFRDLEKCDNDD